MLYSLTVLLYILLKLYNKMIWKKLQVLFLFIGIWSVSNAQTMADFPWIESELNNDNCCNNQSVTVFPESGYAFVYIEVDDECGTTNSKLYFEDGRCWCTDNSGLDCLGSYGLDKSQGVNVYSCTGDTPAYDLFSEYSWLNNVVDQENCCGNSNIQVIDLGSYSFLYVSSDPSCPNDFGKLYFETGQLYCSDASNYDCLLAYGFPSSSLSSAWSCDGEINVIEEDTDTDIDTDTDTDTDTEETDTAEPVSGLHAAFAEFDEGSFQIYLDGNEVVIETDGLPNHTSPYWSSTIERAAPEGGNDAGGGPPAGGPDGGPPAGGPDGGPPAGGPGGGPPAGGPGGDAGGDDAGGGTTVAEVNHPLWVAPTVTSYDQMAPGNIDDFMGSYTLRVSTDPQRASSSTATGLGAIGIAVSGAVIYNDEEGPNVPLDNAVGSLDYTAAHTGPQSYHYHLEPKAWSDDDDKLIGIMADGFFLYGRREHDGTYPTNLDESGGHFGPTPHNPEGEYHYHIQNELYLNTYYILFPGDYQGTPGNIN